MTKPWEKWIPGILCKRQIGQLCEEGYIKIEAPIEDMLDESAIDLSLSREAFWMKAGSVKPTVSEAYEHLIRKNGLADQLLPARDDTFFLHARNTYVFKLRERLHRALAGSHLYGQATAKSSVGRVDVLARLIVDGMDTYERFDPAALDNQNGEMYLEITPMTFSVRVREGTSLSQLRFCYGKLNECEMHSEQLHNTILEGPGRNGGCLTVDLSAARIRNVEAAAFCANPPEDPEDSIRLWEEDGVLKPDPCKYWKFVHAGKGNRLEIEQEKFYILRSKERITVPNGVAIYCRASDETIGEMRIHYAGFVHPMWGLRREDKKIGTPLIFEVRGHQVNVSLADTERLANLTFYRMSEDAVLDRALYSEVGKVNQLRDNPMEPESSKKSADKTRSKYEDQTLQLSKFFGAWPPKLKEKSDGTVESI